MKMFSSLSKYFSGSSNESSSIGIIEISILRIPRNQSVRVEYNTIETVLDINTTKSAYDIFSNIKVLHINSVPYTISSRVIELERITVEIKVTKHKQKIRPEDFTRIKLLGEGSSKVYLVKYNRSGRLYACKVFKKSKNRQNIINEKNLLVKLKKSPFLIPLLVSFQSPTELFLIFPYYKYDLFTLLMNPLPEHVAKIYFCEILVIINHLHSNNIIYRDIKPENILIDHNNHILLCDLDISVEYTSDSAFCGTLEYMPPEVIRSNTYDKMYDYYTLGILLYEMVVGDTPYKRTPDEDEEDLMNKIEYEEIEYPEIAPEIVDLISKLTKKDPSKRIPYIEIVQHEWLKEIDWDKIQKKEYIIEIETEEKEAEPEETEVEEDSYKTTVPGFTWIGEEWEEE